ncbi:MAG: hypothetical protein R6U32_04160 [Candidatus Woesearchaeota archaeon]
MIFLMASGKKESKAAKKSRKNGHGPKHKGAGEDKGMETGKKASGKAGRKGGFRRGWYFLAACIIIYAAVVLMKPEAGMRALRFFSDIILKILPVFILIFALLTLINYFVEPKKLLKYFGKESGLKGYLLSLTAGIISTGPIFMWYPLLNEMQGHGVSNGFLATFLYGRSIKPALLPLLIFYFGLAYTIILCMALAFAAIIQGIIIKFIDEKNYGLNRRWHT